MNLKKENEPNIYINTYKIPNGETYTLYTFELEGEKVSAKSIEHMAYLAGKKFGSEVEKLILEADKQNSKPLKEKFITHVSAIKSKIFRKKR